MPITITNPPSREACLAAQEPNDWSLGDEILYEICERYPRHTDAGEIVAKMWLIGRTCSAQIERGRKKDASDPQSIEVFYSEVVVPALRESSAR